MPSPKLATKQVDPAAVDPLQAIREARAKVRNQLVVVADRREMCKASVQALHEYERTVDQLIDEELPLFAQRTEP